MSDLSVLSPSPNIVLTGRSHPLPNNSSFRCVKVLLACLFPLLE